MFLPTYQGNFGCPCSQDNQPIKNCESCREPCEASRIKPRFPRWLPLPRYQSANLRGSVQLRSRLLVFLHFGLQSHLLAADTQAGSLRNAASFGWGGGKKTWKHVGLRTALQPNVAWCRVLLCNAAHSYVDVYIRKPYWLHKAGAEVSRRGGL